MGKLLIINGADFSANAIEQVGEDIAGLIHVFRGYNRGVLYSDLNRAGTSAAFDLNSYIQQGYNRISIIPFPGMNYVAYISSVNDPSSMSDENAKNVFDGGSTGENWRDSAGGTSIPSTYRYLQIGIRRADQADFSLSEYLASSFLAIELNRE